VAEKADWKGEVGNIRLHRFCWKFISLSTGLPVIFATHPHAH